jgi:hypothetical protein
MSKVACLTLTGAVAAGIVFQAGHFVEHAVQMGVFIFGSHTTPYMSPIAMYLTHLLGTYFFPAKQMAFQMAAGMEILHLIGNLPTPTVRTALWIETFHLYEHIMLTSTVVFLGKAVGLSTLFGGAEVLGGHEFAVGFRVSWHFVLNLVPTIYVLRALMRDAPAAVKAMKLNFATMAG